MAISGAASNVSGGSNGASSSRPRSGRIVGVPRSCWCGAQILGLISKSENNPYRRYFRCAFAVANKLKNDNHVFKWVDEAMLDEIETLEVKNASLEEELKVLKSECMKFEERLFENIQIKLECEILEKVEVVLSETQWNMKKKMVLMVIGCLILIVCMKLIG